MIQPLTAEQKTLEILRGNYPYTFKTLPLEVYTEICEGSESTATLLRDMLQQSDGRGDFGVSWVSYMSGFDGDCSEVERQHNNYEWAMELWQEVTDTVYYLNNPQG